MEAKSFVCKKLRATLRAQQNGNDPAVGEGELTEQPRQQNGNDPAVEQEGELREQLPEPNGNDPTVEEGELRAQVPEHNGTDPAVEVGEPSEKIDEQNGTDGAVKQGEESRNKRNRSITPDEEVELKEQLSQQNRNDPAVEQGKESTEKPVKRNRTITPVEPLQTEPHHNKRDRSITPDEQEVELREQPSQQNRNDPAIEQEDESLKQLAEQNGIGTPVKKEGELRAQLPEQNKKGSPVQQENGSVRFYKSYVTSDQRNDIVDLHTLADRLWCVICDLPISLMNITGIEIDGLVRIYRVHCQICDEVWGVPTSTHCRDYIRKPSKSVANDSDSSPAPSTSQENGSSSAADDSDSSPAPSTSQENGSSSVADDSDSSAAPSTSQGIGSNIMGREYDRVIMIAPLKFKIVSSPSKALTATTGAASTSAASTSTASTSATTASTSAAETSTEAPKVENKVEGVYKRVEGRFIIDIEWLAKKLWCDKCRLPLSLRHVLKFRVDGLVVIFRVHCRECGAEVEAETSSTEDRVNRYKINEQAVKGIIAHTKEMMDKVFEIMDLLPIPTELELFEPSRQENPRPVEAGEENAENPRPEEARGEIVVTLESNEESREEGKTHKSKTKIV